MPRAQPRTSRQPGLRAGDRRPAADRDPRPVGRRRVLAQSGADTTPTTSGPDSSTTRPRRPTTAPAQAAAQVRAIYAYHTKSLGHSDIDYNFLVDRFGRLYEGRAGGMDLPVLGGHTAGFNEHTFAVVALGNFETFSPPAADMAAIKDSIARLFAWKLGLSRSQPGGDGQAGLRRLHQGHQVPEGLGGHHLGDVEPPDRQLHERARASTCRPSCPRSGRWGRGTPTS